MAATPLQATTATSTVSLPVIVGRGLIQHSGASSLVVVYGGLVRQPNWRTWQTSQAGGDWVAKLDRKVITSEHKQVEDI
jgi:hypothetical protein